jgi:uncharacterized protein
MILRPGHRKQFNDLFPYLFPELVKTSALLTKTITFVVTEGCNLNCSYCLVAGTKVLDKNFDEVSIETLSVGDEILGFQESPTERQKQRSIDRTKVTEVFRRESDVIKISFDNGKEIEVTKEHPVLIGRNKWVPAGKLKKNQPVKCFFEPDGKIFTPIHEDVNYQTGYIVSSFKGDGSIKKYSRMGSGLAQGHGPYWMYKIRLAVKDTEIIDRAFEYCNNLGIILYKKPFKISEKYGIWEDALFANTRMVYDQFESLFYGNIGKNMSEQYMLGFLSGIFDTEGNIGKNNIIRIFQNYGIVLDEIKRCLDALGFSYIEEPSKNQKLSIIRIISSNANRKRTLESFRFIKSISPSVIRKGISNFYKKSLLTETKVKDISNVGTKFVYNVETESHTYFANSIAVHNCYETHKNAKRVMSEETARQAVDVILGEKMNGYMDKEETPAVILDFIGGEPLLKVELIDYIVRYFLARATELDHPWRKYFMISISSNGIPILTNPATLKFFNRWKEKLSLTITIDGDKTLHDSCRVYPDGSGSYDDVVKAIGMARQYVTLEDTKVTLAPSNIEFLPQSIQHLFNMGFTNIHANCVFEEGWTVEDAKILYIKMKELANIIIENKLYETHFCSLFEETLGKAVPENETRNWCGGDGQMLAIGTDGRMFPCLRFMKFSLSSPDSEELEIGDLERGIDSAENNARLKELSSITRQSQSTEECLECPISQGCAWCTAYNYDVFGTPDKRATFICWMHRARVLINYAYWKRLYKIEGEERDIKLNLPKEIALQIISEDEYNWILSL